MSAQITKAEVAQHKDDKSMYIIIDDGVYEIAKFVDEHPGGAKILKRMAGKDATKQFWKYHSKGVMDKWGAKLKVGTLKEEAKL
ncbi:cytochrome b5-like heme/steroid binding domain-containing protein [Triangularia setosa]|uniref:Cytochrome b5-like heme/steroid binding domain-containing protein n=1 Tax=Triangularia setosa TaxID=2587417 RepID=A0AAN6WB78_9PEZI|nr:cytochrome b5-like heme/steroid binding domain-containing protein [Podospora setosa]